MTTILRILVVTLACASGALLRSGSAGPEPKMQDVLEVSKGAAAAGAF